MNKKNTEILHLIKESNNTIEGVSGDIETVKKIISRTQENINFKSSIVPIDSLKDWKFNGSTGNFFHKSNRFFSLQGLRTEDSQFPILVQQEIGILGFLASNINGVLHLLVQLKVEPGNPNGFQLSPTVQATRSNYSQVHGGKLPSFLEFFIPGRKTTTIRDTYQSEQGLRYFKKRNRNLIVFTDNPPNAGDSHIWMTLGQIKEFSKEHLLINSCARSVLSMLPSGDYKSEDRNYLYYDDHEIFSLLLDSYDSSIDQNWLLNLNEIKNWRSHNGSFSREQDNDFSIIGVEVSGLSREVSTWTQPLLKESSKGEYGLLIGTIDGIPIIFWKLRNEPGLFKGAELGPSWINRGSQDESDTWQYQQSKQGKNLIQIELAEEGGRFYQAIFNHNIVWIGETDPKDLDKDIIPLTLKQTERFISDYSLLTIEARSLWSLIRSEWFE
tara:strand:+ start:51 stop:1373 length:1323 start_codon:yes stop_codon:yes gene_type:complete